MHLKLFALALVAIWSVSLVSKVNSVGWPLKCAENETFSACNPVHEKECNVPPPAADKKLCRNGCACKKGYERNPKRQCVLTEDC